MDSQPYLPVPNQQGFPRLPGELQLNSGKWGRNGGEKVLERVEIARC